MSGLTNFPAPYPRAYDVALRVFLYLGFLIILLILALVLYYSYFRRPRCAPQQTPRAAVLFLMRSYNRPEYLKDTLASIAQSDMAEYCSRRIIYDDASTDALVRGILNDYKDTYEFLLHCQNLRQKSMVALLDYVRENVDPSTYDHICYLDSDATVRADWLRICNWTYEEIQRKQELPTDKFVLTGFNTVNHPIETVYKGYARKKSIGGIHMYFHRDMLQKIRDWWDINRDWGVVDGLKAEGGQLYCCYPGVVQHIGKYGDNSRPGKYDKAI